jgi:hypothetical protein
LRQPYITRQTRERSASEHDMSLIFKLASRNLFQDRLRFAATAVGIVFSIVLLTIQVGLFLSFERMVTTMIDHAPADLWIVPLGTKCFEDPSLLDERDRTRILSVQGVINGFINMSTFSPAGQFFSRHGESRVIP